MFYQKENKDRLSGYADIATINYDIRNDDLPVFCFKHLFYF